MWTTDEDADTRCVVRARAEEFTAERALWVAGAEQAQTEHEILENKKKPICKLEVGAVTHNVELGVII